MTVALNAIIFKNPIITFDGDAFTNEVSKALLTPEQSVKTYKVLVPNSHQADYDDPVWTLTMSALQINNATGLAAAMRAAQGTNIEMTVQEKAGVGFKIATFDVMVPAIPFGGEQGEYMQIEDIEIAVVGAPAFTTSA